MTSSAPVIKSLTGINHTYRAYLGHIPDALFQQTPAAGGWSYSEVYSHIFDASLLSLMAMQECISGKGENRPVSLAARLILLFGRFPPMIRFKVPKRLESRVKKITKAEALQLIGQFETRLAEVYAKLGTADPNSKTAHPRLGFLNAPQWLRFTEIHLRHHLKQLNRLENSI